MGNARSPHYQKRSMRTPPSAYFSLPTSQLATPSSYASSPFTPRDPAISPVPFKGFTHSLERMTIDYAGPRIGEGDEEVLQRKPGDPTANTSGLLGLLNPDMEDFSTTGEGGTEILGGDGGDNASLAIIENPILGSDNNVGEDSSIVSNHPIFSGSGVDKSLERALRKELQRTVQGRMALKTQYKHKVKVKGRQKGGSSYTAGTNTARIDLTFSLADVARMFIHELHHAECKVLGTNPDRNIKKLSREDYLRAMLEEETEAKLREIDHEIALGRRPPRAALPTTIAYLEAYNNAREEAAEIYSDVTYLDGVGRAAGVKRIYDYFASGEALIAENKKTYIYTYGKRWDDANRINFFMKSLAWLSRPFRKF